MSDNVYQDIRDVVTDFEGFLEDTAIFNAIKTVVDSLKPHVPLIGQLLDQLIDLIEQLETKIGEVNVGGAINQVPALAEQITGLIASATSLLGAGAAGTLQEVVDQVAQYAPLVTEILASITTIKTKLTALNGPPA
jgi:capsule polysaccharide export protein KpsE/RkpR